MSELPLDSIICGDNCEVMATFPADCIDLVVTSPPYGELREYGGHTWDFEGVAQQLWRVVKPGGVVVWVVADQTVDGSESGMSAKQAEYFRDLGFRQETMIWNKGASGGAVGSNDWYFQSWEYMFCFSKGNAKTINRLRDRPNISAGRNTGKSSKRLRSGKLVHEKGFVVSDNGIRRNVWDIGVGNNQAIEGNKHPAPFPEALARDHILSWSNEGDVVLDPFNGSGTTTKMAREMGRRWIGIEINEAYCEIARRRLLQKVFEFVESK